MVIGKDFVWAHLGKAAGNSTLSMFLAIQDCVEHYDPIDRHSKHFSFLDKEKELNISLSGRKRILNIRRLPSWILSYANFQKKTYSVPIHEKIHQGLLYSSRPNPDKLNEPQYNEIHVDDTLIYYEYKKIDYWLRTEFLADDFISTMRKFTRISRKAKKNIQGIRDNVNVGYNRNLQDNFSDSELEHLYDCCPVWKSIEERVYGNILLSGSME